MSSERSATYIDDGRYVECDSHIRVYGANPPMPIKCQRQVGHGDRHGAYVNAMVGCSLNIQVIPVQWS